MLQPQILQPVHDLVRIMVILIITAMCSWITWFLYQRHQRLTCAKQPSWRTAIVAAGYRPLQALIWSIAIASCLISLFSQLGLFRNEISLIQTTRALITVLTLFWFAMRLIHHSERTALTRTPKQQEHEKQTHTKIRALSQLARVLSMIIAALLIMQTLGLPMTTLLTVSGVGSLAIGFAAQDTLANFIGGVMIFWDRPFSVGDWIRSPDRNIEGTVEHVGWRLTRIRTFDKRPLYVPNGAFSKISIENPSRMLNRRIKTTVGLRYQDASKVQVILADIETMLREHPEIDTGQTLMVNLFEFGASSLNFFIYTFTKTTEWVHFQSVQQNVLLQVIRIITAHGAECAFPTTTLDIPAHLIDKLPPQPN